jgi:D-alanyl-D-alanine carboxypeptidase (penicillin-binding protein 5/6)
MLVSTRLSAVLRRASLVSVVSLFCVGGHDVPAKEDLNAPPATTAKAWAVADGATGQVLASHNGDEPLKAASTTKTMCALVVVELAEKDPAILDERITFSKLADTTDGSTSGIKAGESITVRDGLYALLLPSGNDMGNAFAEHFNKRLQPPGAETPASVSVEKYGTRRNFVAEMNRTARRLGMAKTVYRIPYGDGGTDQDHTTTVHDLLKLGREAMKHPLLQTVVKTVKHTARVGLPNGKWRDITWENTNKLLTLGTYDGIKTGQTNIAGYCLLATGELDGRRLYVAVLGSDTEPGRFVDTRNLFRWAWSKPADPSSASPKAQ